MGTVSPAVKAFRARFEALAAEERALASGRAEPADAWLGRALELHALALWQDIERVRAELPDAPDEVVVAEVNRRRLASSPLPPSLVERWRTRGRQT